MQYEEEEEGGEIDRGLLRKNSPASPVSLGEGKGSRSIVIAYRKLYSQPSELDR